MSDLVVPARFCGPPQSGNGGWTAGAIAEVLVGANSGAEGAAGPWPAIEVTLRRPPPLERPLRVRGAEGSWVLLDGDELVADAMAWSSDSPALAPVAPVAAREARTAAAGFPGLEAHPFPTCFVCGPARGSGDGLRIFPGPLSPGPRLGEGGETRVAATWTPDASLIGLVADHTSLAVAWAALDCPGGWSSPLHSRPIVLGRIRASVLSLPRIGVEHVIVGEPRGGTGRKSYTACSAYDDQGSLVATAEHVWLQIDPATFETATAT